MWGPLPRGAVLLLAGEQAGGGGAVGGGGGAAATGGRGIQEEVRPAGVGARAKAVKAELVKLRYFAGLTGAQAAQALGVSTATAERYWNYARAWLHQEMTGGRR
jgi:hypothetical protein